MRLNESDLRDVDGFLRGERDLPESRILDQVELGVWIFPALRFVLLNIFGLNFPAGVPEDAPLFLGGRFGNPISQQLLKLFREKHLSNLMVRVDSWQVYLNCNGEVMSDHCDEDLDEMRLSIEKLRRRCNEKYPAVVIP